MAENSKKVVEYRDRPTQFVEPNAAELKARKKRNIALAVSLLAFMLFIFVTMVTRSS